MAKIKFYLNIEGSKLRTLDDLRESFFADAMLAHYQSGKLAQWLNVWNYKDELEQVQAIHAADTKGILSELCRIFGVEADLDDFTDGVPLEDYLAEKKADVLQKELEKEKEAELQRRQEEEKEAEVIRKAEEDRQEAERRKKAEEQRREAERRRKAEEERMASMKKYLCMVCNYVYNPEAGDPTSGALPGTIFEYLPKDWTCPICGVDKSMFESEEYFPDMKL